jgi:hypothetical protein
MAELQPSKLVMRVRFPSPAPAQGGRNTAKAREGATAQGSQVEDRGRAPAELAARFSAATRTKPREPSRSARTTRSHSSAELRALSWRIFIHVLEYPLTLSRLAGVRRGAFSIILVGNRIADYVLSVDGEILEAKQHGRTSSGVINALTI